jgi:hypothetical protein
MIGKCKGFMFGYAGSLIFINLTMVMMPGWNIRWFFTSAYFFFIGGMVDWLCTGYISLFTNNVFS